MTLDERMRKRMTCFGQFVDFVECMKRNKRRSLTGSRGRGRLLFGSYWGGFLRLEAAELRLVHHAVLLLRGLPAEESHERQHWQRTVVRSVTHVAWPCDTLPERSCPCQYLSSAQVGSSRAQPAKCSVVRSTCDNASATVSDDLRPRVPR